MRAVRRDAAAAVARSSQVRSFVLAENLPHLHAFSRCTCAQAVGSAREAFARAAAADDTVERVSSELSAGRVRRSSNCLFCGDMSRRRVLRRRRRPCPRRTLRATRSSGNLCRRRRAAATP